MAPGLTAVSLVGERDRAILEAELEEDVNVEGAPEAPRAVGATDETLVTGTGINLGQIVSEAGDIRVIADERNNALVFLATAGEFRMIESTLKRLDIVPLQVMIEATIAEVGLNDTLEYGLQWFFENGDVSGIFSTDNLAGAFPGFNFLVDTGSARVVLSALSDITEVNVISSPLLMVLDNQTARLQVGDQVPVLTTQSTGSGTDVVVDDDVIVRDVINNVEMIDTGVILEVTPRVNASGLVVMDIIQEVSDAIRTTTSDIESPTIQQRLIQSTVAVQSGATVALGGLIRDRTEESEEGLPLLSQIPILGNLFKTTSDLSTRTELLVLITPRVVRNQNEAKEVTDELRRRMHTVVPLELEIL